MSYGYFIPSVNLMGKGCISDIAEQVKTRKGTKVLVVTDKPLVEVGIVAIVTDLFEAGSLPYIVYDEVQPNPTCKNVHDGLDIMRSNHCDFIVAVGGGSAMDCAKGIGIVAENGGNIRDYEGLDRSKNAMTPMIAVNTTAGTASEMTRFTIITDEDRHVKMAIVDWHVTPILSVNDPELMVSMPASLTAATGMDALTHAVEAYVSTAATPVTDSAAIYAISLIGKNLGKVVANGTDIEAREMMAYAQFMAGMAFNNASLGYVHAMAHQLGGVYDLPHGVCNAILLPYVCEFNLIAKTERFIEIAKALGEEVEGLSPLVAAKTAITAIKRLSESVGIPAGLRLLNVNQDDFDLLADNAMKDACMLTNPRIATKEQIIQIYKNAY